MFPEQCKLVHTFDGDRLCKVDIESHGADTPRLMGKGAERIKALRWIAKQAGEKLGCDYSIETLRQPTTGEPTAFPKFRFNSDWPSDEIGYLVQESGDYALAAGCQCVAMMPTKNGAIFTLRAQQSEHPGRIGAALTALQNIFGAIGARHGAFIKIDIKQN